MTSKSYKRLESPQHKEKIDRAVDKCEKILDQINKRFDKVFQKDLAAEMKELFLKESFFAGGMFRSAFTGTLHPSTDLFFKSEKAATRVQEVFQSHQSRNFSNVLFGVKSPRNTFTMNFGSGVNSIKIITQTYGTPQEVLDTFDFTFNQHYYSVWDGSFQFDLDTFKMRGAVTSVGFEKSPSTTLQRLFLFQNEGFKLPIIAYTKIFTGVLVEAGVPLNKIPQIVNAIREEEADAVPHSSVVLSRRAYADAPPENDDDGVTIGLRAGEIRWEANPFSPATSQGRSIPY